MKVLMGAGLCVPIRAISCSPTSTLSWLRGEDGVSELCRKKAPFPSSAYLMDQQWHGFGASQPEKGTYLAQLLFISKTVTSPLCWSGSSLPTRADHTRPPDDKSSERAFLMEQPGPRFAPVAVYDEPLINQSSARPSSRYQMMVFIRCAQARAGQHL